MLNSKKLYLKELEIKNILNDNHAIKMNSLKTISNAVLIVFNDYFVSLIRIENE